jgi:hypothetical protein
MPNADNATASTAYRASLTGDDRWMVRCLFREPFMIYLDKCIF